jgi:transcription-repair coupling factor (superfamily II helicase)
MSDANFRGVDQLRQTPKLQELRRVFGASEEFSLSGCFGSPAAFLLGQALDGLKRPTCILLQDEEDMESFMAEFKTWTRQVQVYSYPFVHANITTLEHSALLQQMKGIRAMLEPDVNTGVWVSTLKAMEAPCFSLDFIDEPVLNFELKSRWNLDELALQLEKRGFARADKVDQRGDYSVRGGILDIFPRFASHPVRLEFFGDEVDTIREFSAVTQKSLRRLTRFILDDLDYEKVNHLRRDGSIMDYLPENILVLVQEPELSARALDADQIHSGMSELLLREDRAPRQQRGLLRGTFARQIEQPTLSFDCVQHEPMGLSIKEAMDFLSAEKKERNQFLLESYGSSLKLAEKGSLDVWTLEGPLEYNFAISDLQLDVFHEKNLVQIAEIQLDDGHSDAMADFLELELGDYIVHENYGIGQFLGLTSMEKNGLMSDFLLLQFAAGSKVYVPVAQLSLVQKYIGRGDEVPELSKVGSKSWDMKKKKARKAIDLIVMELVQRQAFRESQQGFAFSADTPEQRAFERAFPYTDTPCQTQATSAIKREMEKTKPMDHLLCGDVGFGKTEVAMRIAHKAILDNKQVAVLAPTTVLAQQHYNNFCKRFKARASEIAVMDRFTSASATRAILLRVLGGEIKILIGTHRLFSNSIEFADLALMILDEEQRFGVKQKESLKKRYPDIDVLSLSATPIPRTLHLSMLGIRGISNLTIPPENRHAIRTYIREKERGIILHAIGRELARGGQSYYLHNRVEDILQVRDELQAMFPTARIGVGHGQMNEAHISEVMRSFYALEIDIFLSTSIVANGIDIPTANTMIINDAHLFGLSELHQIRGRIGRYSIQAYCYLLLPKGIKLPSTSMRRLRAIEEHQELGSGFKLAMRDMEIRGVGNILGEDQHGQIADIGYELYAQYLGQAIAEMRGKAPEPFVETELSWPIGSTYFPKSYIASNNDRIDFYRRISFAKRSSRLRQIGAEIQDRFGAMPAPTVQLLEFFIAKMRLREMGILSFKKKDQGSTVLVETYRWENELKLQWVLAHPKELAFYGESHIVLKISAIWNRATDEKIKKDIYAKHSYYNEDDRPEPLEVLKIILDFMETSLRTAQRVIQTSTIEPEDEILAVSVAPKPPLGSSKKL